jgi:putative zinc finger/helix-turn-helix YgiT family protein
MKSPITGKEMILKKEKRSLVFRKEEFPVLYHYYQCKDSKEQFTSTELDDANMKQIYNQYRDKYNLPFPDDINGIREKYGVSATKMSEILGFGVNSYRNYESGEVPSLANARLIQLANDPKKFKELVELSDALEDDAKDKLLKKIDHLNDKEKREIFSFRLQGYLLDNRQADEYTGYRKPNLDRLTEMVVFFTEELQPWKTKMNKLLFYADFLLFKKTCTSMSGACYRAINMGPVPNNFNSIFEYMANNDDVDIYETEFQDGHGEQFKPNKKRKFNSKYFSEIELATLREVAKQFKTTSTKAIIEISHQEKGWKENEQEKNLISYQEYAFDLSI